MPANERVENPMLAEAAVGDGAEEEGAAAQSEEAAAQAEPRAKWERMVDALVAVYYVVAAGITGVFIAGLLYGGVFILTHFTEKTAPCIKDLLRTCFYSLPSAPIYRSTAAICVCPFA